LRSSTTARATFPADGHAHDHDHDYDYAHEIELGLQTNERHAIHTRMHASRTIPRNVIASFS
jgi:hypothetical protein